MNKSFLSYHDLSYLENFRLLLTYQNSLYLELFLQLTLYNSVQQQVFGPSDTVSIKNKNAKYTTAQQKTSCEPSSQVHITKINLYTYLKEISDLSIAKN